MKNWLCYSFALLPWLAFADAKSVSIAELQQTVLEQGRLIESFRVEGWVRAVIQEQQTTIVLEDDSGAAKFEIPLLQNPVKVGERAEIDGQHCLLIQTHSEIRIDTAPVVENQGPEIPISISGNVFLEAGLQPVRLEWYARPGDRVFNMSYEGPGIARQTVPSAMLYHQVVEAGVQKGLQPGMDFLIKPYSTQLPQVAGVVTNFDLTATMPSNDAALFVNGLIRLDSAGIYTFYLKSSGEGALWVGQPSIRCARIDTEGQVMPGPKTLNQALASQAKHQWVEVEGEVTFAGISYRCMQVELIESGTQNRLSIMIDKAESLPYADLIHRRIRVQGICEILNKQLTGISVPHAQWVQILDSTNEIAHHFLTNVVLTTVVQVRRLKPDQARMHLPVRIQGVLITASMDALVLQDPSGGVWVRFNQTNLVGQPHIGELWEIDGTTDPGEFSPIIIATKAKYLRNANMPEPAHPTWNQLMNGNLDAEYVELYGVLCSLPSTHTTLLMPDGKITVDGLESLALPQMSTSFTNSSELVGSLVRLRGCFIAKWNLQTREAIGGNFELYSGVLDVDESAPMNPFSLSTTKVADLLWFNASSPTFQRTKVMGQVIYSRPGEYFIMDDQRGARILTDQVPSLRVGDIVEAVGFPKLSGPSPVIQECQVRKIGHQRLPSPKKITPAELLDRRHDSTLVQVVGVLVNEVNHKDELVLEMQAGPSYFSAKLNSMPATWPVLSVGSQLELTGVYARVNENLGSMAPFELLLTSPFDITVLKRPTWWTTRHSVTVVACLAAALGIAFIWITLLQRMVTKRTDQLQKTKQFRIMEQERVRIAQDLHDELGAGLTEVGLLGALATNHAIPLKEKESYLDQLKESIKSLVTGLDEIVWAINPRYDSVGSLVTYYSLFAQRFLNLAGIACRLTVEEPFPDCPFDSKLRHGVFLAFKEALNNVVRHSQAKETEIKMAVINNQLVISIRDNGQGGISDNAPGQDGLIGMRERLRLLGGVCKITNPPTGGTNVELCIALNQKNYD